MSDLQQKVFRAVNEKNILQQSPGNYLQALLHGNIEEKEFC